jgi:hypothetical protein
VTAAPSLPPAAEPATVPPVLVPTLPPSPLCRRGWHRWRRTWVGPRPTGLASVTSRCDRTGCLAIRHDQNVPTPRDAS